MFRNRSLRHGVRWTLSGEIALFTPGYTVSPSTRRRIIWLLRGAVRRPAMLTPTRRKNFESGGALKEISNPENLMLSEELRQIVFRTIESLPEDLRMAITLRELDGLSYEEIAAIMDCPVGTVRSRIFRAREAIDNKVQPLIRR
ncbi:sigma-70 family RNA polymerase sigma factor [Klebsiella pneumoniae]